MTRRRTIAAIRIIASLLALTLGAKAIRWMLNYPSDGMFVCALAAIPTLAISIAVYGIIPVFRRSPSNQQKQL